MRIPLITVYEWRSIAPLLPPTNDPGKARQDERLYVSAFYYAEATRSSLENLPAAYGNPRPPDQAATLGAYGVLGSDGSPCACDRTNEGRLFELNSRRLYRSAKLRRFFRSRRDPAAAAHGASRPVCGSTASARGLIGSRRPCRHVGRAYYELKRRSESRQSGCTNFGSVPEDNAPRDNSSPHNLS